MITIYSTPGLARLLVDVLRNRELLDGIFFFGFLLIGASIIVLVFRRKPSGLEIGVWLGILAIYMMVFARLGIPEERTHLVEYGVVALLIYEALKERASQGRYAPALLATLSSSFLGVLDECIQAFLPNRLFDPRDIFFNVLAGVVVIFASMALSWVRKRMMQAPLNLFK